MTDRIEDERVAFYLKHQRLIDTWAAVRKDAVAAAHSFYVSLVDDLSQLAPGLGSEVEVWSQVGNWSNVGLFHRSWFEAEAPLVLACFEWNNRSTFVDGSRTTGLRIQAEAKGETALRPYIADRIREIRTARGFGQSNSVWPAYRAAPNPSGDSYWQDLSEHRETLVAEVGAVWGAFASHVGEAVAAWRAESR